MDSISSRIGLVGDVHGHYNSARFALTRLATEGIGEVHFLGDFGFVWKEPRTLTVLVELERVAAENNQTVLVTGGNHENYDLLEQLGHVDDSGIRWLTPRIGWLPRGWRATAPSGRAFASLGGANSIDFEGREPGKSWWPQESITEADLAALGTDPVDVLLAHDAPPTRRLMESLRHGERFWGPKGLAYSRAGQAMFARAVLQVRPQLTIGGHYHQLLDTVDTIEGHTFRSVILNESGMTYEYIAILDTGTLEVDLASFGGTLRRSQPRPRRADARPAAGAA